MSIKSKITLLSIITAISFIGINNKAKSTQINDNIYGHINIFGGLTLQNIEVEIDNRKYTGKDLKNNINGSILIGIGYNLYFSVHEFYHPFIGLDLQGKIPLKGTNYLDDNNEYAPQIAKKYYQEVFLSHIKLGTKLNISGIFAISPYGIFGFNLGNIKTKVDDLHKEKTYINYSVGFGFDVMFFNRFILSLEYRYAGTRQDNTTNINHHNVSAKFGIELF